MFDYNNTLVFFITNNVEILFRIVNVLRTTNVHICFTLFLQLLDKLPYNAILRVSF